MHQSSSPPSNIKMAMWSLSQWVNHLTLLILKLQALDYRNRQLSVLNNISDTLQPYQDSFLSYTSFRAHPSTTANNHTTTRMFSNHEVLSLESAFDWLRDNFQELFDSVVGLFYCHTMIVLPLLPMVLTEIGPTNSRRSRRTIALAMGCPGGGMGQYLLDSLDLHCVANVGSRW